MADENVDLSSSSEDEDEQLSDTSFSEESDNDDSERIVPTLTYSLLIPQKRKHEGDEEDVGRVESSSTSSSEEEKKEEQEAKPKVWKWWREPPRNDGMKWTTLKQKGPYFAPEYKPLPPHVKFYYSGEEMKLSTNTEEVATFYAKMLHSDFAEKDSFNTNFFSDWRVVMTEDEKEQIKNFSECNFEEMYNYFQEISEKEKEVLKKTKKEIAKEYGFCQIDGRRQKIDNWEIEPPGLFTGRGKNSKSGTLKKRVLPKDVIINCSEDSDIPSLLRHEYKEIVHKPRVAWLASWTDNITNSVKYVKLHASSQIKGQKHIEKYNTARRLNAHIDSIRHAYRNDWDSDDEKMKQLAVALYLIDKFGLRVGNEKGEERADTTGCCSLKVKEVSMHRSEEGLYVVCFDFIGKGDFGDTNVFIEKRAYVNLQQFMKHKALENKVFNLIKPADLIDYISQFMDGLTLKVFRTYRASITFQQKLKELTKSEDIIDNKVVSFDRAVRAAAELLNHKRTVPKNYEKALNILRKKIEDENKALIVASECLIRVLSNEGFNLIRELNNLNARLIEKEKNKDLNTDTIKLHYLDPRIAVAWCKKNNVPIEKVYTKAQREIFAWAIDMATKKYDFRSATPENDELAYKKSPTTN